MERAKEREIQAEKERNATINRDKERDKKR